MSQCRNPAGICKMVMTVIGFRPVRPILNTASWQRSSGLVRLCYRFGPFVSSGRFTVGFQLGCDGSKGEILAKSRCFLLCLQQRTSLYTAAKSVLCRQQSFV